MAEGEERKPWDRQAWESAASFRAFHDFYLIQDPPRSIDEAWRRNRAHRGIVGGTRRRAPGSWRRRSLAHDRLDNPILGGMPWTERAAAWDQYLADQAALAAKAAADAIEAAWRSQIMGPSEVLARLSEEARQTPALFLKECELHLPAAREGEPEVVLRSAELDWEAIKTKGHLIKKISFNQYGPILELYDAQDALQLLGKHHGQFNDRSMTIDLSRLTDEQLARLADGEDIIHVLATPGKS